MMLPARSSASSQSCRSAASKLWDSRVRMGVVMLDGLPPREADSTEPRTAARPASEGLRGHTSPARPHWVRFLVFSKPTETWGGGLGIGTTNYGRIKPCNLAHLALLAGCRGLREVQGGE